MSCLIYRLLVTTVLAASLLAVTMATPAVGQSPSTEEIVVRLEVPKLLQKDIFVHFDGETIYVPLLNVFSLLDMNVDVDSPKRIYKGKYLSSDNKFEINLTKAKAKCFGETVSLPPTAYVSTATELFLRIDLFKEIFRLKMQFNFSEMNIYMPLSKDFPAYVKLKRQQAYKRLKEKQTASLDVYEIPYKREMFRAGAADWVIAASPNSNAGQHFQLGLGCMLFGGDFAIDGTGGTKTGLNPDQIKYRWHYFFDNNKYITQAEAGEISTGGYLNRIIKGGLLTNKPQIKRKYFQTINVSGFAGEGWDIELWVNNRLIDYTRTDANGDYNFLVDVNYGSTRVMLKKYGPNGEVETEEKFATVPFNLLPKNKFEYTVAAGQQARRANQDAYGLANAYYGLLDDLTVGFSTDIPLESNSTEQPAVAMEATYQLRSDFLINAAASPQYTMGGGFTFSKPNFINLSGSFARYFENESRNPFRQVHNAVLSLSTPLRIGNSHITLRSRVAYDEFVERQLLNVNFGFSASVARIHLNYLGNYKNSDYLNRSVSQVASQLFVATSMLRWVRPQVRLNYDHQANTLSKIGLHLNKRIFLTGQITTSFERNTETRINTFMVSFRILNNFAEFVSKVIGSRGHVNLTQTQKGSVLFNQDGGNFRFNHKNAVGYGSAVIRPFHDENYNGIREQDEQLLTGLRAKLGGAAERRYDKNKLFYYDRLRPYDQYLVEIDEYSLDNPQLLPSHENYAVAINPNSVTTIEVPIITAGEVTGQVERRIPDGTIGVGGVTVIIINESTGKQVEIMTFNNGEYFHLGLAPGVYKAIIDPDQLKRSGFVSEPASQSFQIKTVDGGDYVENTNFLLVPRSDTP
jgi:hypothetical protein